MIESNAKTIIKNIHIRYIVLSNHTTVHRILCQKKMIHGFLT